MTGKIRDDLEGVVSAYDADGKSVVLKAGDTVPAGVEVGDHVFPEKKAPAKPASSK